MTIRVVLAAIDGGPASEAAVRAALVLAEPFAAHIQVLHVRPDPESLVPMIGEGMSGAMLDQMLEGFRSEMLERAGAARRLYDSLAAQRAGTAAAGERAVTLSWREEEGREDEVVARLGRVHDVIVLARGERHGGLPAAVTLEGALLQSGRPVLVAPAAILTALARRVVIAWNGKAQSARALAASLPFLARAEQIWVTTVVEAHTPGRPADVVRYLAWHGIRAAADEVPASAPGKVGPILLERAAALGSDLLVMGAYGHSRLKEMILGGATREVLGSSAMPVLMVH